MAKVVRDFDSVKESEKSGAARPIGGGVLMPGTYSFPENPMVRWETTTLNGRNFTNVELETTNGRWINLGLLLRRKADPTADGTLTYVNPWVMSYSDVWDLAAALKGCELVVTSQQETTMTNYKGGQLLDAPVASGKAYVAEEPKKVAKAAAASKGKKADKAEKAKA